MDYATLALQIAQAALPILGGVALKLLRDHNVNTSYYEVVGRGGALVLNELVASGKPVTLTNAIAAAGPAVSYVMTTAAKTAASKGLTDDLAPMVLAAEALRQAVTKS